MSKPTTAPGALELVRAFVNTQDPEPVSDALESAQGLAAWLEERELVAPGTRVTRADLARAVELREALRQCLLAHNGEAADRGAAAVLDGAAQRAGLGVRFPSGDGVELAPSAAGVAGALGRILAAVVEAMAEGTWTRLKACREGTCQWAYYDRSKNRSRTWCSMAVCGNRTKVKAYRERRGK